VQLATLERKALKDSKAFKDLGVSKDTKETWDPQV
jgi:hypothetical protein